MPRAPNALHIDIHAKNLTGGFVKPPLDSPLFLLPINSPQGQAQTSVKDTGSMPSDAEVLTSSFVKPQRENDTAVVERASHAGLDNALLCHEGARNRGSEPCTAKGDQDGTQSQQDPQSDPDFNPTEPGKHRIAQIHLQWPCDPLYSLTMATFLIFISLHMQEQSQRRKIHLRIFYHSTR
jgi:hypothetical protein